MPHSCRQLTGTTMSYSTIVYLGTYVDGQLNVTAVQGTDGSTSIVYGDIDFLQNINGGCISVDTTFKMIPIAWALMERKTMEAYIAVLQHFATNLAPHIRPTAFMTDYERALANALRRTYPEAREEHCFFHYCQALMKQAKKLNLVALIRDCYNRGIVFRKIMALALLPPLEIPAAFQWIIAHVAAEIATDFQRFFRYYERQWLQNVGPQGFSVFGLANKTNNDLEAYHRVLGVRMGTHPSVWRFTEHLRNLQIVIRSSYASLNLGLPITRHLERQRQAQRLIQRAWQLYEDGLMNVPRFLSCASYLLKTFNRELLLVENDIENFINPDVQAIQENNVQDRLIFLEENLDEIQILRRPLPGGDQEVILLFGLVFQACVVCRQNAMDTITLPCGHWCACAECTRQIIELSVIENLEIRCGVCGETGTAFHTIVIILTE